MHYFVLFLEVSTIEMLEAKFPAVKVLFVSKIFSSVDLSVNSIVIYSLKLLRFLFHNKKQLLCSTRNNNIY